MWKIESTSEYQAWWNTLAVEQRSAISDRLALLREQGPALGPSLVRLIETSKHRNMKELRVSQGGALRVLFIFDPRRRAILLLGGDKADIWNKWYRSAVRRADALYDDHLRRLRDVGAI